MTSLSAKDSLREEARRARAQLRLTGEEGEQAAQRFMTRFGSHLTGPAAAYWPMRWELDTLPLLEKLDAQGVEIFLPTIRENAAELDFARWTAQREMKPGRFGFYEPVQIGSSSDREGVPDLGIIILPLLAFDRRGTRLGSGRGYYDRTIEKMRRSEKKPLVVGYAFDQQMCLFPLPCEGHDQRLDYVVTPGYVHDVTI